jgi:hypothetical protein
VTARLLAKGAVAFAAALILVGMIELSSVTAERRAARAARHLLFADTVEADLAIGSETDSPEPAEVPTLTR